jgi:hypothetical protein
VDHILCPGPGPARRDGARRQDHRRDALVGDRFHDLFVPAALDPLRAVDCSRIPSRGKRVEHVGCVAALRKTREATEVLGGIGSPTGSCAWFVLGCEHSLRLWAQREGWNGRPLNQHVATGILFGTLGVLVKHFGC